MQIKILNKTLWLNYHHLYYFKVIAQEGSIAQASKKLKLGQPTLSAQLKQFEDSLGVQLFDRQHKKLVLNEAGKLVNQYASEIFRMGSEMIEVIHDQLPTKRVHIQIGVIDSVPKHITLKLAKTALSYGNCSVSILEGRPDELMRELSNHKIDLIVSNFVPTLLDRAGFFSRSIAKTPISVFASEKFKHLKKGFPKSLDQAAFILPTGDSKLRHDIEHYCKLIGIRMDVVVEAQDVMIQKLMGMEGLGLVPVAHLAVSEYVKNKQLYEIGLLSDVFEEIFLISASRKIENPISSQLMKSFHL